MWMNQGRDAALKVLGLVKTAAEGDAPPSFGRRLLRTGATALGGAAGDLVGRQLGLSASSRLPAGFNKQLDFSVMGRPMSVNLGLDPSALASAGGALGSGLTSAAANYLAGGSAPGAMLTGVGGALGSLAMSHGLKKKYDLETGAEIPAALRTAWRGSPGVYGSVDAGGMRVEVPYVDPVPHAPLGDVMRYVGDNTLGGAAGAAATDALLQSMGR